MRRALAGVVQDFNPAATSVIRSANPGLTAVGAEETASGSSASRTTGVFRKREAPANPMAGTIAANKSKRKRPRNRNRRTAGGEKLYLTRLIPRESPPIADESAR